MSLKSSVVAMLKSFRRENSPYVPLRSVSGVGLKISVDSENPVFVLI